MMPMGGMFGIVFGVIWFVLMVGMVAGWIIFLVALWRMMRAHEYLARSAQDIADGLHNRREV